MKGIMKKITEFLMAVWVRFSPKSRVFLAFEIATKVWEKDEESWITAAYARYFAARVAREIGL